MWVVMGVLICGFIYTEPRLKGKNIFIKILISVLLMAILYPLSIKYNNISIQVPVAVKKLRGEEVILKVKNDKGEYIFVNEEGDEISEKEIDINKVENIEAERESTEYDITQGRVDLWKRALQISKENVIIGSGLKNFREYADRYFEGKWPSIVRNAGVHNIYIMILAVGGILGLAIFITFVIYTIFKFSRFILFSDGLRSDKLFMVFIISMFIEELIESRMIYMINYYNIPFFMILGYCFHQLNKYETEN